MARRRIGASLNRSGRGADSSAAMDRPLPAVTTEALLAHAGRVRRLARALASHGSDEADEAEQQAWLLALERPPARPGRLAGWWRAVVTNVARKRARDDATRMRHEQAAVQRAAAREAPPALDAVARAELHHLVVDAVVALDEPYRSAIVLRWFDGLPPAELARRLGVPVETARTRVKRGLTQLRARLGPLMGDQRRGGRLAALFPAGGIAMSGAMKATLAAAGILAAAVTWHAAARPPPASAGPEHLAAGTSAIERADAPAEGASLAPPAKRTSAALNANGGPGVDAARAAAGASATGLVIDDSGRPVAGAFVVAFAEFPVADLAAFVPALRRFADEPALLPSGARHATTAPDGRYELRDLPREPATSPGLHVAAIHAVAGTTMWLPLEREQTVRLAPPLQVEFVVLDPAQQPVPGATVQLFASFAATAAQGITAFDVSTRTAGADARAVLELPPVVALDAFARAPGMRSDGFRAIELPHDPARGPIALTIVPIARTTVAGTLALAEGGSAGRWLRATLDLEELSLPAPLGASIVAVEPQGAPHALDAAAVLAVGELDLVEDRFTIDIDADAPAIAVVARDTILGWIERQELASTSQIVVEPWRLPSTRGRGAVRLRVTREGDLLPPAAYHARLDAQSTRRRIVRSGATAEATETDADGCLLFRDVQLDALTLTVDASGCVSEVRAVELSARIPEVELHVELRPGPRTLRGELRGARERGGGAAILCYEVGDDGRWTPLAAGASLDERGATRFFQIARLPATRVGVVARLAAAAPAWRIVDLRERDAEVVLEAATAGRRISFDAQPSPRFERRAELMTTVRITDAGGRIVYDGDHPASSRRSSHGGVDVLLPQGEYVATLLVTDHEPGEAAFSVGDEFAPVVRIPVPRRSR